MILPGGFCAVMQEWEWTFGKVIEKKEFCRGRSFFPFPYPFFMFPIV